MDYSVLIPSAGLGTRLGVSYKNLNKALVTIDNKPVISHIIEKFPLETKTVIALGHKANLLKDYLKIAHKDRNISFVHIDKYCGVGSGLGYTILQCKKLLQCPFIFSPNDTYVVEDIPPPNFNWLGFAEIENDEKYRSLKISDSNTVEHIYEKEDLLSKKNKPYIGLAGINNYKEFWEAMENGKNYGSINIGESYAIKSLIKDKAIFKAKEFTWYDTGNIDCLEKAKKEFRREDSPEILDKQNEAIWFVNKKVIKYSKDTNFIKGRVERASLLEGFVPKVEEKNTNMYSYTEITGKVMSKISNKNNFRDLLFFLNDFWEEIDLSKKEREKFYENCLNFYKKKTADRLDLYFSKYSESDSTETINGLVIPPVNDLCKMINWNKLSEGIATRIHGDLHFENILMKETGSFCLLDWRQDFGGIIEFGDKYYDLAKLLHGLIVSHELINKNHYFLSKSDEIITLDFYRKNILVENEYQLVDYVNKNGLDMIKVKLLTSLIYINIAPLHHHPYSQFLFYLGKYNLFKTITENKKSNLFI